jgi:hypothetical protein
MSEYFNKVRTATERDTKARWNGGQPGELFRCGFCGHKIQEGENYLILYTNDLKGAWGNPLVCYHHLDGDYADLEELRERWAAQHKEFRALRDGNNFWWFFQQLQR